MSRSQRRTECLQVAALLAALIGAAVPGRSAPGPAEPRSNGTKPAASRTNAKPAELKLVEVRATYGRLGSTRSSTRVLPGEDLNVVYVVSGISRGSDGRSEVSRSAELFDEAGESISQVPTDSTRIYLALGGDILANHMHFGLPLDFPPGKYKVRGVLTDVRTGTDVTAEQQFEVLPLDFGVVRLRLAGDPEGRSTVGGNLTVNQEVYVVGRQIGFSRKGDRIHTIGNLTIADAAGKLTTPVPIKFEIDQVVDDDALDQIDFRWSLPVNRPGRFTVQIEVRDEIADKRIVYEMPLVVAPPPALEKGRPAPEKGR
ncbi:MAG: hypothetical protein EXS05_20050 [Planctomycetaceae bacterium]|nr:hypothetical protein [Planctomycetaceae bacterium]